MTNVYGQVFVASTLEDAVRDTLIYWYPDYLHFVETQVGFPVGALTPPRHYTTDNKANPLPAEQTPKCIILSPGLRGEPLVNGEGVYRATWALGIGIADGDKDADIANTKIKVHGATVRLIMLHKQDLGLGGKVGRVDFVDESYDDYPVPDQLLQYKTLVSYFTVEINGIAQRGTGPATRNVPPTTQWGQFTEVDVELVKEALSG